MTPDLSHKQRFPEANSQLYREKHSQRSTLFTTHFNGSLFLLHYNILLPFTHSLLSGVWNVNLITEESIPTKMYLIIYFNLDVQTHSWTMSKITLIRVGLDILIGTNKAYDPDIFIQERKNMANRQSTVLFLQQ